MKRRLLFIAIAAALLLTFSGCGGPYSAGVDEAPFEAAEQDPSAVQPEAKDDLCGLSHLSTLPLVYASQFSVDYYENGYKLISVSDGRRYLLIPEGKTAPEGLDGSVVRIHMPVENIYLAATSAMALFNALDALPAIRMSGARAESWSIENAVTAMEAGDILYAGKYSEPDYELLMEQSCGLAIENTMILHTPKVQEMIEMLGIPVLIERSSYETHPLGRTEWIKLYGAMLDKEDEAEAFFTRQAAVIDEMADHESTGKTVAFFYLRPDGNAIVRRGSDYVPKMIELAGGCYIFSDLVDEENRRSSVSITMEEFYAAAKNADFLIYNTDIDTTLDSLADLLAKSELFADFKAVQEGNVWYTGKQFYQATDIAASFITDVHLMLEGESEGMTFLTKLE